MIAPFRTFAALSSVVVAASFAAPASAGMVIRTEVDPGAIATLNDGTRLYLEVRPPRGPSAQPFLLRYLDSPEEWRNYRGRIAAAIPYERLKASFQRRMLLTMFTEDYVDERGWWHVVSYTGNLGQETISSLASWTTGSGGNAIQIRELPENAGLPPVLQKGNIVFIPRAALRDEFREPTPERSQPKPLRPVVADAAAPPPAVGEGILEYGRDAQGTFAGYRLRRGEALYSSVVVRCTDFRENADIHDAINLIMGRSGISDARNMESGDLIKIPMDLVSAQYQPAGSEARREYEAIRQEATILRAQTPRSRDLEGVVIVLDPGHGGRDHGAKHGGLLEDELTYDMVCRIKALLESQTRAKVYVTLSDPSQGWRISNLTRFPHDTDEELLTTPRYWNQDARSSANLRWYLANAHYRHELQQGVREENMLFASIHCDALFNSSMRGAMVYIPGAQYRRDREEPQGAIYAGYREAASHRVVTTTAAMRRRDEAMSRNFALTLLQAMRTNDPPLKVHSTGDPIRNVIRQSGGRAYVPAVLRNSLIPTKVLVETANLTNATDRERLADPAWRQWFAEAFVRAVRQHFEGTSDDRLARASTN